jgi:L-ascorbate metabolism protein UlaG (beta-lactamase superfamily)
LKGSRTVYIDPFLKGNPTAAVQPDQIKQADLVVVTHGHGDHLGDAFEICKKTGATLASINEIAVAASESEGITAEPMAIGGSVDVDGVTVHLVNAQHTMSDTGHPAGAVIEMDGKTIYHMGDTGLFSDMKLIGDFFKPDLAMVPVGDRFTMGPKSASMAVEMVGASVVIPMHYGTFPIIRQNADEFVELVGDKAEVVVLDPGSSYEL